MSMMGFDATAVPDAKLIEKSEQQLECFKADEKTAKDSGRKMILLALRFVNDPTADPIFHNLCLPVPEDEQSTKVMFGRRIKEALEAFGVGYTSSGFNIEDFKGKFVWANVDIDSDPAFGTRNVVKGWTKRA